jgi:DNA polymerase I-like protein with 3'-5' exonuclease and polymerase domains
MRNVTLDFESSFDPANGFGLRTLSTEDYIAHPKFEVILVSGMIDDEAPVWFSGTRAQTKEWMLDELQVDKAAVTGHHLRFDASVLAQHFDIHPKFLCCTEYMANPTLKPRMKSLGLKALAEHFQLPPKGDEVTNAMGMWREDFSPEQLQRYAEYSMHDTWLCRQIYKKLRPTLSTDEMRVLDMVLRMYTQPQLEFDISALELGLRTAQERKALGLAELEVQGITKKMLSSGEQFARLLRDRGVEPPMKVSPAWLKKGSPEVDKKGNPIAVPVMTYAFGKSDPEFLELKDEFAEDEEISALLNARTETKSTQEETRCTKFIEKAKKHGVIRAPVVYYSTHTGRLGGDEGENVLNLTNPGKHKDKAGNVQYKSRLRFGFAAPKDHVVVALDYSQIEARITAEIAGQDDLVQAFREGRDVYSEFAQDLYKRPVSKQLAEEDPQAEKDRKSGKETILGAGFGMGDKKFKRTVRGKGLILTDEEAKYAIDFYRAKYERIENQWGIYTAALNSLLQYRDPVPAGLVTFDWDTDEDACIILPNGMRLLYPGLHLKLNKKNGRSSPVFQRARDKWPQNIWGGVVMNNVAQSTAGILIRRAMVDIQRELKFRPALQIYDEVVYVIPASIAAEFVKAASALMTRTWDIMPNLPIAVEAKTGPSYGHV